MLARIPILNRIDPFILVLIAVVTAASLFPASGKGAIIADAAADAAIVLLFFLHGAKLSRAAMMAGLTAWRIHLLVLASTFLIFPALGLLIRAVGTGHVDANLLTGILFLSLLPSTVQSSVAFTAIARGNVAAAVCSASLSNIAGIFITPLLASLLIAQMGSGSAGAIEKIALQLLLPFVLGHLCRPLLVGILDRYKGLVGKVDRGSILLVVYTAFSASVIGGLWQRIDLIDLVVMLAINAILLSLVMAFTWMSARRCGLSTEDEIVVLFCGSKKSLVSGVPMAGTLFPSAMVGSIILPLMLFHQMQLMVCAVIAQRYRRRAETATATAGLAAVGNSG